MAKEVTSGRLQADSLQAKFSCRCFPWETPVDVSARLLPARLAFWSYPCIVMACSKQLDVISPQLTLPPLEYASAVRRLFCSRDRERDRDLDRTGAVNPTLSEHGSRRLLDRISV